MIDESVKVKKINYYNNNNKKKMLFIFNLEFQKKKLNVENLI